MSQIENAVRILSSLSEGRITQDQAREVLKPAFAEVSESANQVCKSLHNLMKAEGDWRFHLADGIVATVNFSGTPNKRHLKAFVAVFTAKADNFVEAE